MGPLRGDRHGRHRLDRRQRWADQEGVLPPRDPAAQRTWLVPVQLRHPAGHPHCGDRRLARHPDGRPMALPAALAGGRGHVGPRLVAASVGRQRLSARHPVPRRDRPDDRLLGQPDRLLLAAGRERGPERRPRAALPVQPDDLGGPRVPADVLGQGRQPAPTSEPRRQPRHRPGGRRLRPLGRAARLLAAAGQLRAGAVMSGPVVVEVRDLSKRFVIRKEKSLKERVVNFGRSNLHKEDFWALRDVSFEIESGTSVGLIGPNGSGKSTLLKLIGGILQPTSGTVATRGRMAALLELGAGFHPDLTGRENVYLNASILGLSTAQTDKYFDAIVDFSGIERFIDTQVKFYSSGMYVRLAFAVAVHVDPDILLVDEVLAVGDEPFQRKCMDRIRADELSRANVEHGEEPEPVVKVNSIEAYVDGQPVQTVQPGQPMTVRVT